jgi:hypothetical protein
VKGDREAKQRDIGCASFPVPVPLKGEKGGKRVSFFPCPPKGGKRGLLCKGRRKPLGEGGKGFAGKKRE